MRTLRFGGWPVALVALAACAGPTEQVTSAHGPLSATQSELTLSCEGGAVVALVKDSARRIVDVKATAPSGALFEASGKVPALNARIEDGTSHVVQELVDFNDAGLESIPVDGPMTLEIDLVRSTSVLFKDVSRSVELACSFDRQELLGFLGLELVSLDAWKARIGEAKSVGFDIDDTLAFTTSAFVRGFATGGSPVPQDGVFWNVVNGCDPGCPAETITLPDGTTKDLPAASASTAKAKARELIAFHKARGARVYAITARPDVNGDPLRGYVERELGIARDDVFFEPDMDLPGNPKGKTDRIESLGIDVFYGDSDSDITDARHAFDDGNVKTVAAVRFLRSPKSSNRKAGRLAKYHPGYFGEPVLEDTYE